jgi:phthalate 4,5-dioxygenase oxygenase subunit
LMCRVGPGTPMGNFLREYWIPALQPSELPSPDCPPLRIRLLGENLIAFRVTSGEVGLVVNACPHRGASLFFGRNEEEGLRCVYHGWKFDVAGNCVDMPSEPAESNFKSKVRATAYPVIERNGIVWTYMGARSTPPELPKLPPNLSPECRVNKSMRDCSYMQALEGDIDTVHWGFLHAGHVRPEDCDPGSTDYYATRIRNATLYAEEHEAGTSYGAWRPAEADTDYWRMGHFMLPFYTYNAPGILTRKISVAAWVPLDDDHMMVWNISAPLTPETQGQPGIGGIIANTQPRAGDNLSRGPQQAAGANRRRNFQPDTTDWLGKFRSVQTLENDYLIDREAQKTMLIYSGIPNGAEPQDRGMQESMGPIYDRTQEHLGTTDMMVIAARRKLIMSAKAYARGEAAPGVDKPELYWMFSGGALVPKGANGIDYCRETLWGKPQAVEAFVGAGGG